MSFSVQQVAIIGGTMSGVAITELPAGSGIGATWTPYVPVVTATSGAFTTVSATGRFLQMGKTIFVQIDITQTAIGTASGGVLATLPFPVSGNANYILAGRELLVNGKMLQGIVGAAGVSSVEILNYDNTSPIGNGFRLVVSGVYEAA